MLMFSSLSAVVPYNHQMDSPDFIRDLLPAAEKTALLYNISYLCLAKFPSLERIIRANAVEAQMLFSSSEALLLLVFQSYCFLPCKLC
jgi:hypothetical protein